MHLWPGTVYDCSIPCSADIRAVVVGLYGSGDCISTGPEWGRTLDFAAQPGNTRWKIDNGNRWRGIVVFLDCNSGCQVIK